MFFYAQSVKRLAKEPNHFNSSRHICQASCITTKNTLGHTQKKSRVKSSWHVDIVQLKTLSGLTSCVKVSEENLVFKISWGGGGLVIVTF